MTMVRYSMRTDSGGLLRMHNNYQYTNFNTALNIAKFRLFLRRYIVSIPEIVDTMADCLNRYFPDKKISTEFGGKWQIEIPSINVEDIDLYRDQLSRVLLEFLDDDIVKAAIKTNINEEDKIIFYDLLHKFKTFDANPNLLVELFMVPKYDKEAQILVIIF